ncbi:MAG: sulfatase-like hydrolase/transferase [Myxococcota bacterium]
MNTDVKTDRAGWGTAAWVGISAGFAEAATQWLLGDLPLPLWNGIAVMFSGVAWGAAVAVVLGCVTQVVAIRRPVLALLGFAAVAGTSVAVYGAVLLTHPAVRNADAARTLAIVGALCTLGVAVAGRLPRKPAIGWSVAAAAIALSAAISTALQPLPPTAAGPTIVLVSIDGLRADALPPEGTLAAWAARSAQYTRAVTPTTDRLAAAKALLPTRPHPCDTDISPLPMPSAAFVSSAEMSELRSGFHKFDDDFSLVQGLSSTTPGRLFRLVGLHRPPQRRDASVTLDAAASWLATNKGGQFAWIHLDDPRPPFEPGDPWDKRFVPTGTAPDPSDPIWMTSQYQGEVAAVDHHLARLFVALPNDAIVAVVGTYGEPLTPPFNADGPPLPGLDASIVPLIIGGPGVDPGQIRWPVSTRDVGPTLLALAGASRGGPTLPSPDEVPTSLMVASGLSLGGDPTVLGVGPTSAVLRRPGKAPAPLQLDGQLGPATNSTLETFVREVAAGDRGIRCGSTP